MKFFSVNKLIEEMKLLLGFDFETLTLVMNGTDMYNNNFDHTQGVPCLVKVDSKKKGTKIYKYKEMRDLLEDDYTVSISLPRKFAKEYIACTIDVTNPQTSDKFDGEYFIRRFSKCSEKVLKMAKDEQKYIDEQAGIEDTLFDL